MSTQSTSMPTPIVASTFPVKGDINGTATTTAKRTATTTTRPRRRKFSYFTRQLNNAALTVTTTALTLATATATIIPTAHTAPVPDKISQLPIPEPTGASNLVDNDELTLFPTPEPGQEQQRLLFFLMLLIGAIGAVIIFAFVSWYIDSLLGGTWRQSRFRMFFDNYTDDDGTGSEISLSMTASTRSGDNDDDFTTDDIMLATTLARGEFPPSLRNLRHARRSRLILRKLAGQMVDDGTVDGVEDNDKSHIQQENNFQNYDNSNNNNGNSDDNNESEEKRFFDDELDGNCPICLEPLKDAPLTRADCGHVMHLSCISKWLIRDRGLTCPICRMRMRVPTATSDDPAAQNSTSTAAGTSNSVENGGEEREEHAERPSLVSSNGNGAYSNGTEGNGAESYAWDDDDEVQWRDDASSTNTGTDHRIQQNVVLRIDINPSVSAGD